MKPARNPFLRSAALAASIVLGLGQAAFAGTFYWDGITGNWDTLANWSTDLAGTTNPTTLPLATVSDILNFNTTPGNANSSTLYLNGTRGTSAIVATMNFSTASATTTTLLGGVSGTPANNNLFIGSLTVNAGSGAVTIGDTAASPTAKVDLKAGSISITNNSGSLLTLANGLNSYGTGSTTTFTFTGSGNILSGGVIGNGTSSNVVALTKTGNGILTLKGANTYSSTTTLTLGTIQIGAGNLGSVGSITSSAIGRGTLSLNGGTISSDGTTARTILNAVTYSNASTFGSATNNGKLTFSAAVDLGTSQKTMTVNSDVQFDGILSGALGGISLGTSTGFGKLSLTNTSNSFTGNVTLNSNSGTLRITSSGALGVGPKTVTNTSASNLVPVTGANLLELDSNGGADISLASNISFSTSGSAGVILNTAGNNAINGTISMTSGNGNTKIISNGGSLNLAGNIAVVSSAGGFRVFELSGTSLGANTVNSTISDYNTSFYAQLVKSGAGTWTIANANAFTGPTKVTGGTLKLTNNLAIQNSAFDTSGAGTLDLTDAAINTLTIGGLIGDATTGQNLVLASNVTTLTLNPTVAATINTYVKNFSGGTAGLTLTKTGAGTQVLSGTNSYSGNTAINAGSLQIESAGALGSSANIAVSALNSSALVLNNVITGSGKSLTISGPGVGGFFGALSTPTAGNTSSEWQGSVTIGATTLTRIGSQSGLLKISGNIGETSAGSQLIIRNADAAGTTLLSGNNNYTGGTSLFKGYLQLGSANALGTGAGTLSFSGGFLSSDGATARTIANPVAFTAAVTLGDATSNGKLTFSNTVDVGTTVKTLTLASDAQFDGSISGTSGTHGITTAGVGNVVFNGAVTRGAGTAFTFVKGNSGTVQFNNALSKIGLLTLNGGTIDLAADLALNDASGTALATGFNGSGGSITSSGGKILLAGGTAATNGPDWGSSGTVTISAAIADGGTYNNIDFYNTGTFILQGANTFSGRAGLYGAAVQIGVNSVGSVGSITSGALGKGLVSFQSGAKLSSDGATARTILNAIEFASNATLGDATRNGKLTFSAAVNLGTTAKTLTLASDAQFDGVMSGALGGITKAGAGTLTLSNAANSYTGVTTFQTGIVNAAVLSDYGVDGSLGNRASEAAANVGLQFLGGTLQYTGSTSQSTDRAIRVGTAGGTIDASGTIASATMSFTKTTANVDFFNNPGTRTLTLTGSNAGDNLFAINIQDQATGTRTSLAKTGSGTWLLTNANNSAAFSATTNTFGGYGGGTTISGGTLAFADGAIGGGVVNFTGNATLRWEASNTQDITTGTGSGVARSVKIDDGVTANFNTNGNDIILSNALGVGSLATGGVIKTGAGALTLSNTNTYTGTTQVNGGTLKIATGGSLDAGSAVSVSNSGSELIVNGTVGGTLLVNTSTTLSGTGAINGAATIHGIHNPGNSPGHQTFASGLAYSSSAVLNAEFVGDTLGVRGTDFDGINVTGGDLSINSLATLNLLTSGIDYTLAVWDIFRDFTVIDYSGGGTSSGIFLLNTSSAGSFAGQGSWSLANTSGDVVLSWAPIPEPRAALLGALGILVTMRRRRS